MKTAKIFQKNQKTVLKKKNVYLSVSMDLRIVVKVLQKTDSFSKRLQTAMFEGLTPYIHLAYHGLRVVR